MLTDVSHCVPSPSPSGVLVYTCPITHPRWPTSTPCWSSLMICSFIQLVYIQCSLCWALRNFDISDIVLVSPCYCNKVSQMAWFRTREIYSLIVVEARSSKSRCQRGGALCPGLGWLPTGPGPLACSCITANAASVT